MTMGETATALASVGVLAQIDWTSGGKGLEWLVQLGVRGLLIVGIVMLWRRMEKQDKADRDEREKQRQAEQKRHDEDREMNKMLLDVLIKLNNKKDRE